MLYLRHEAQQFEVPSPSQHRLSKRTLRWKTEAEVMLVPAAKDPKHLSGDTYMGILTRILTQTILGIPNTETLFFVLCKHMS